METTGVKIIVKRLDEAQAERKSPGGIILPASVKPEEISRGEVVAVGPKVTTMKQGDIVNFPSQVGDKITLGERGKEEEYLVMKEQEVLVID